MDLAFQTKELRDVCERRAVATAKIGVAAALELEQRLADIDAVETAAELIRLFPDYVVKRASDEFLLRLSSGHELVLRSGHVETATTPDGSTDWTKVMRFRVMALDTDHV